MRILQHCVAVVAIAAFASTNAYAQFSEVGAHSRISDGPNAEANGGGDTSLLGLNNPAGINNWGINQWDLTSVAGVEVTEVTLTFAVATGFTNGNHGGLGDTVSIHQVYDTNAGWLEGGQIINSSNVETNGGVTFNFQSQTSETTGTAWKDASGADVANFLGCFDPVAIDTLPGWEEGSAPELLEFTVPLALAQSWVDDPASFAGIVLVANDDGDSRSRYNLFGNPAILSINPILIGDVNLDGVISFLDIGPFIDLLASTTFQAEADINVDDAVDFLDIQPFIDLLAAPPETP